MVILSMASDGEMIFRIGKYVYRAWIDTTHYPHIRACRNNHVINYIKKHAREVKRVNRVIKKAREVLNEEDSRNLDRNTGVESVGVQWSK